MRILIFGATGMLGSAMSRFLSQDRSMKVYGTVRSTQVNDNSDKKSLFTIINGIDVENYASLVTAFSEGRPDIVINCVGLVKQLGSASLPLQAIPINALLPHKLALLCKATGARLIHVSTDCVFSGKKGNYLETDFPDADDLYGRSKFLGEVDYPHAITLRTSIIGHELAGNKSLLEWFLKQERSVNGYTKAIFSGLPTVELARVVRDFVLPKKELRGVYHVATQPISKFELLKQISQIYNKNIEIIPTDELVTDRSLNAQRFNEVTGYTPPKWSELIKSMHEFQ